MNDALPDEYYVTVEQVENHLRVIELDKASGPDNIEAWMLRVLASIIAHPITAIIIKQSAHTVTVKLSQKYIDCPFEWQHMLYLTSVHTVKPL